MARYRVTGLSLLPRLVVAVTAASAALVSPPLRAAVIFEFNYTDALGNGFNAAGQLGADRRAALQRGANIISRHLGAYSATIQMSVDGSVSDDDTLASAGSEFSSDYFEGFGNRGDVGRKILGGNSADPAPGAADGFISWNFEDNDWALADNVGANSFDFVSTAVHELGHAIGFLSTINEDGSDPLDTPPDTPGASWNPFDDFVGDADGLVIDDEFALDGERWADALTGGTDDGLFFHGEEAVAANGGLPVNLFSPGLFSEGSSVSHLDDDFFTEEDLLMESEAAEGRGTRRFSDLELAMLRDIGFTDVAQVPLPAAAWMLASAMLALLGMRRLT